VKSLKKTTGFGYKQPAVSYQLPLFEQLNLADRTTENG